MPPAGRVFPNGYMGGPLARFLPKVVKQAEAPYCWIWTGARNPRGYGVFGGSRLSRSGRAHRWSYERLVGRIPSGLYLDHLCKNAKCVNPKHLEPVTQRENVLRGSSTAADRAKQSHCIHGHPFDAANTYVYPNGRRKCRACQKQIKQRRKGRGASYGKVS